MPWWGWLAIILLIIFLIALKGGFAYAHCPHCDAHIRPGSPRCPHCGKSIPS